MSSVRHLGPADYRVMPWKNGLGTTTELAVDPIDAGLDGFLWRVSIAELKGSGPFSSFPGIDRIILQTDGAPMELVHGGGSRERLAWGMPYRFEGEWPTHAKLTTRARDFNVMTRRAQSRAGLAVHELGRASAMRQVAVGETQIVYALFGAAEIIAGGDFALAQGETLVVTGCPGLEIVAPTDPAVVLVVDVVEMPGGA